jgi:hypothetical protein
MHRHIALASGRALATRQTTRTSVTVRKFGSGIADRERGACAPENPHLREDGACGRFLSCMRDVPIY